MPDLVNLKPRKMYVGDSAPNYQGVVRDAFGDTVDLTGWTVVGGSIRLFERETATTVIGTGTLSIVDAVNGLIRYVFAVADTATAGTYDVIIRMDTTGALAFTTVKDKRGLVIQVLPA